MKNIFESNFQKYENPAQYDTLHESYQDDLIYIIEQAQEIHLSIIDLACGTGRLTIPMSKQGLHVIGVDLHEGMLNRARKKATVDNLQIQFEQQDCTELKLNMKSPLIFMTGNSFQHFLTNESQDKLLQSVSRHLEPGGEFVFDTRNPVLAELSIDDVSETVEVIYGKRKEVNHSETYNHSTQILHCVTETVLKEDEETLHTEKESISLRYTYPMELKRLLEAHEFELVHLYGTWKKLVFTKDSPQMIVHCRKRG
ncbi:class I SAM-dependent methyltransferase [Alkalicoccobacillus gibsonii]|uniref:Class I SAM-dependent methyltransferase n=1 Tax=Alkalicoccobacillus gibsonii TaxID=79881 RepID=A0ABU9VDD0_9BACI